MGISYEQVNISCAKVLLGRRWQHLIPYGNVIRTGKAWLQILSKMVFSIARIKNILKLEAKRKRLTVCTNDRFIALRNRVKGEKTCNKNIFQFGLQGKNSFQFNRKKKGFYMMKHQKTRKCHLALRS